MIFIRQYNDNLSSIGYLLRENFDYYVPREVGYLKSDNEDGSSSYLLGYIGDYVKLIVDGDNNTIHYIRDENGLVIYDEERHIVWRDNGN